MSRDAQQSQNPFFTMLVLWGALLTSTFIYLFLVFYVDFDTQDGPRDPMLAPILAMVACIDAGLSLWLPRRFFRVGLSNAEIETREVPDPDASVMFRDQTPMIRVFADRDQARRRIASLTMTPFILGMAMAEAVAVFGFLLGIMGYDPMIWTIPFFVIAWALMLYRLPLESRILARAEEITGVRFEPK